MQKLFLLFTKDGLQWHISKGKNVLDEASYFVTEETSPNLVEEKLDEVLLKNEYQEIEVLSALNHFSLTPDSFNEHELGYQLIAYNANVDSDKEELMLSINKKFGVQFYYSFPKEYYQRIKAKKIPTQFNFSGEKLMNVIQVKNQKEIHINLYHHQVEFLAFDRKKLLIYNNLDVDAEVDFLYFIMFTLSKINFNTTDTRFFIYGETKENETFISELKKFVTHLKVVSQNAPKKNFILN